jgi:HEAT repeat protein
MTMIKNGRSWVLALAMLASACHADLDDPKGQAEELSDPVRREHAMGRLQVIFGQRLQAAKGDRSQAPVKDFNDVTVEPLVKLYLEHPEDTQNGLKVLSLLAEMRDPRALPALMKALEWRRDVTEDHAVTAARTMAKIDVPDGKRGEVVDKIAKALSRVEDARPLDNRMRKAFIEVLGKLGDKRATPTLVEVMVKQDKSQNFLFNILAAQQLVEIADPEAVPALLKALYLFDASNPAMRMNDVAASALVAVGKPALQPLIEVLEGKNKDVNLTVKAYIETVRRKDEEAASRMHAESLISVEATYTLGKLGFHEALDPLLEETKSDDPTERFGAAIALIGITREEGDTQKIVDALERVYNDAEKTQRPQMLVAMRHVYADEMMPVLLKVASSGEDELPTIKLYAFAGYALLATAKEAAALDKLLEAYVPAIKAAKECDKDVACWIKKLKDKDKVVLRKAASMLARFGRDNEEAIKGLVELFGHSDLEVRNEALYAVDAIATKGSKLAVDKISQLQAVEGGRSIWNNFKREALPTRSRLMQRGG